MSSRRAKPDSRGTSACDATARDALERLVRVVNRCGFDDVENTISGIVNKHPKRGSTPPTSDEIPSAPHVMTVWHDDRRFLDTDGDPLPLRLDGPRPSFRSLVRSVDRGLNPLKVMSYLVRAGAIRKRNGKLHAVKRVVILRGIAGPRDLRVLRSVAAMLRTADHNSMPESSAPGWLERMAENDHVPVRVLGDFSVFLERLTMGYLGQIDTWMRSAELERKPGERTVKLGVGMYRFQDEVAGHGDSGRRTPKRVGKMRRG